MRVGSIQQLFSSNTEMVRHLFKELLEDGKEHSTKEIIEYIFNKTRGRGVKDRRLTEKAIQSAIRTMFFHGHNISYRQTRKGFYQKGTAAVLSHVNDAGRDERFEMQTEPDARGCVLPHG